MSWHYLDVDREWVRYVSSIEEPLEKRWKEFKLNPSKFSGVLDMHLPSCNQVVRVPYDFKTSKFGNRLVKRVA